jgi:hypothetical protein
MSSNCSRACRRLTMKLDEIAITASSKKMPAKVAEMPISCATPVQRIEWGVREMRALRVAAVVTVTSECLADFVVIK